MMKTRIAWILMGLLVLTGASVQAAGPVISNLHAFGVTANEAFVQWYTNVPADESVDYGLTAAYGSSTTYTAGPYTNHVVHLTGLTPTTLYHWRANSSDGITLTSSPDQTFTTQPLVGTGHVHGYVVKDDNQNGIADVGESYINTSENCPVTTTLCATSDVAVAGITISISGTQGFYGGEITSCDPVTGAPVFDEDLPPGDYTARISRPLLQGWVITGPDFVPITVTNGGSVFLPFALYIPPVDTTPPAITNVFIDTISSGSARVSWSDDEEATCEMDYGTTPSLGSVIAESSCGQGHSMYPASLQPSTKYYFTIKCTDQSGNTATSTGWSFTTLPYSGTPQAPTIAIPPTDVSVNVGVDAVFTLSANGDAPLSYQWQSKAPGAPSFSNITSGVSNTFIFSNPQMSDSGTQLLCIVSNGTGTVTSNTVTLTVTPGMIAPSISAQPLDVVIVSTGQPASFNVTASGSQPLAYQWWSAPQGSTTFTMISGATSSIYSITSVTSGLVGSQFYVVVSNGAGSVTSSTATITLSPAPAILIQPQNVVITALGQSAFFSVTANGAQPLTYQWWQEPPGGTFSTIPGATNFDYTVTSVTSGLLGYQYYVVISNNSGTVTSNIVTDSLSTGGGGGLPTPDLSTLPTYASLTDSLTVNYSSSYNVTFHWSFTPASSTTPYSPSPATLNAVTAKAPTAVAFNSGAQTSTLASYGLTLGSYQVTVYTTDNANVLPQSPTSPPKNITLVVSDFSLTRVYPSPWRADRNAGKPVTFDTLPIGSTIKIFTVSGHLVKTLTPAVDSVTWDLTNKSGDRVASGIYLYLITVGDSGGYGSGQKITGKIGIIR